MLRRCRLVAIGIVLAIGMARAEIIDRILAVVDGALITQSDATGAIRLGLVRGPSDPVDAVVDRLIERRLMLREVDRYAPPDPAQADVDRSVAEIRARAGSAGAVRRDSPADRDRSRSAAAPRPRRPAHRVLPAAAVWRHPADGRGDPAVPTAITPRSSRGAAVLRPFEEAHDVVKAALVAERRAATIRDWLADLRRRANVNVLPR